MADFMKRFMMNPHAVSEALSIYKRVVIENCETPSFPAEPSRIVKMSDDWMSLVRELGSENDDVILFHPSEHVKVIKRTSEKTSRDMLENLTKKEAAEYCRYLRLPLPSSAPKEEQAERIAAFLGENPYYYLWHMDEDEAKDFLNICRQEDGEVRQDFGFNAFCCAIGVGLAEVFIKNNGTMREVEVCIAKDAISLMKTVTRGRLKSELRKLSNIRKEVFPILQMYGILDFRTFFEISRKCAGLDMEEEEFYRFLYWHLKMRNEVQTAVCAADNKFYVALEDVAMMDAVNREISVGVFFLHKECTREDCRRWSKGFCQIYIEWKMYGDFLAYTCGIDQETLIKHLEEAFHAVRNGAGIRELTNMLLEIYTPRSAYEYKEIWETHMSILMETSIYGLKGYNRREIRDIIRQIPGRIPLAPEDGLSEKQIGENSHIYQMSREIQEKLFFVMDRDMEYAESEKVLEKLLKRTGGRNREIILYVVSHYACNGKFKKAYDLVKSALKKCGDADGSFEGTLRMLDSMVDTMDDFEDGIDDGSLFSGVLSIHPETVLGRDDKVIPFPGQPEGTYRRETKKIGRNDPCPCGSGKKYKQCCGRK